MTESDEILVKRACDAPQGDLRAYDELLRRHQARVQTNCRYLSGNDEDSLALALTFGLGSRDITRNLIAGFYARKIFSVGETIEIHGREGFLAGITPVHALVEEGSRVTSIPNSVFLEEAVRQ